jgi:hypothetical protein
MSGHASQCPCRNLVNHGECPRCICGCDDCHAFVLTSDALAAIDGVVKP